jgi:hypothetical protein
LCWDEVESKNTLVEDVPGNDEIVQREVSLAAGTLKSSQRIQICLIPNLIAAAMASSPPISSSNISSSSSKSDFVIEWYGENKPSETDLLEGYFSGNPRLAKQVSDVKANKGKRQTDANLVRDYKFTLEVYDHLLKHEWKACLLIYSYSRVNAPLHRLTVATF